MSKILIIMIYQMIDGHLKIDSAWGQIPCFLYYATLPKDMIQYSH